MAEKQRVVFDMSPKLVEQIDQQAERELLSRSAWLRRTIRAALIRAVAADAAKATGEPEQQADALVEPYRKLRDALVRAVVDDAKAAADEVRP
jgi:hypothetical protein